MISLTSWFMTFIPPIFLQVCCGSCGLLVVRACPLPDPDHVPLPPSKQLEHPL